MRQTFRILGTFLLSLLSLDIVVWFVDWMARWEWLENFISAHPYLDKFVHSPVVYLALLIGGFVFLQAEKWLKQPRIVARLTNSREFPNMHRVTMKTVFNEAEHQPGWDLEKLDWEWFTEIQLANDSDIPTTVDDVEVRVRVGHRWWFKKKVQAEIVRDMQGYIKDMGHDANANSTPHTDAQYVPLDSLLPKINGKPLTRGIGHDGWLRFDVRQISRRDMNNNRVHMDIWLVDALQGKHKVSYKRKSNEGWDRNFLIFEDSER